MTHTIGLALLIDDEEIDQKSYRRVMNRSGVIQEIMAFTYADEALEYLKSNPSVSVDVIFLDINMPRMNGFEFLEAATREIGEGFAEMVVVMLTTSIDPLDKKRASENPLVRDFLNKPLTVEDVQHVAKLLNESRPKKISTL